MSASRLGPRDPKSSCGAISDPHRATEEQEYMVMKTASVKSRRMAMTRSSKLPVRRERERLEGVVALGGGRTRVDIGESRRAAACKTV